MEKGCIFATDFEREIATKEKPHSSSGPGHLPLTQKIISSTLICGTKTLPRNGEVFSYDGYNKNNGVTFDVKKEMNMSKKRLVMMVAAIVVAMTVARGQMQARFGYSTFYLPEQNRSYVETYLQVDAWTVMFEQQPNGVYRGTVEVSLVVRKMDSVYYVKKYDLNSPTVASLDELDFSFVDLQRFALNNGLYDLELTLRDKGSEAEAARVSQKMIVNYVEGTPSLSSVMLVSEVMPTQGVGNMFSRNGYDMEPYVGDYYPRQVEEINYYYEVYNIDYEVGSRPFLAMAYIEQQETGSKVDGMQMAVRKQSERMVPVFGSIDIRNLPSGNYNLTVELRNRDNQTMLVKRTPFFRSNPGVEGNKVSDFSNTFVGKYTDPKELAFFIDALDPIASDVEREVGRGIARDGSVEEKQAFLYRFWTVRSMAAEEEWLKYKERIDYVQENFSYPKTPGIHTDRGRIYLRYGPPDYVRDEKNFVSANRIGEGTHSSPLARTSEPQFSTGGEPTTTARSLGHVYYLPYQLWRYNHPKDDDANRVFIFWDEHRSGYYNLLHSNARGQIQEIGWERRLCRGQLEEGVVGEVGEQFNRGY